VSLVRIRRALAKEKESDEGHRSQKTRTYHDVASGQRGEAAVWGCSYSHLLLPKMKKEEEEQDRC
jgi:hypothetical protein